MKTTTLLQFSVVLLIVSIVYAQERVPDPDEVVVTDTERVSTSFVTCPCSKSGRGFQRATARTLATGLQTVYENVLADQRRGLTNETSLKNARAAAKKLMIACATRDGYEACVNADFALRPRFPVPMCYFDKVTKKNLNLDASERIVTTGKCNARSDTKSSDEKLSPSTTPVVSPEERFPKTSARAQTRGLECRCSPSGRGYSNEVKQAFSAGFQVVVANLQRDRKQGLAQEVITRNLDTALTTLLNSCSGQYGIEACINAEAGLRTQDISFCIYDKTTGKNIKQSGSDYVTLPKCSASTDTRSLSKDLGQPGTEPPVPTSTSTNLPSASGSAVPTPTPTPTNKVRRIRTEGCVAVEHLQGYVLQHREHLLRPVLCSRGFCATPNHGIIVDGRMTSMKQLCLHSGWECTNQVKLVNNLKLSANRRAKTGDNIIVTPYDVRFPKIAIWVAQMLEDIWSILALSMAVGVLAAASGIFISNIQDHIDERNKL